RLSAEELVRVALVSMAACRRHLAPCSHPKSPRRFTRPQRMTCLVLKALLDETYRGAAGLLELGPPLRAAVGLERVPDPGTPKRFADRAATPELLDAVVGRVLERCAGRRASPSPSPSPSPSATPRSTRPASNARRPAPTSSPAAAAAAGGT
ncbi:MAG TPA: hypothetical protein VK324_11140, partial [Tepidisphaeraceae bacterium]|nr:hypothetical protein [Tepidisphaeraceae bacterium]